MSNVKGEGSLNELEVAESTQPEQFLPAPATQERDKLSSIPAPVFVISWIAASSGVIIFNKWILHTAGFAFPIFLTTWHLLFATIMTQMLARFTKVLDSRHKVPMTAQVYIRAILPIAVFNSLSLVLGNMAYLYLSVSFIQMLKATNAVATLLATWALGLAPPDLSTLGKVSVIVFGVMIASFGEIKFQLFGFLIQVAGIAIEATRLVLVQRILSGDEFKMEPLVSLYYFAPATVLINAVPLLFFELPTITLADVLGVGPFTLLANAGLAFLLNVAVVFLVKKTSAVVLTLCGVLKDILLVIASMVLFKDPVTLTQVFGYGIALSGLMYYKLGPESFKRLLRL